jgi:glycosyltransferase involved in cell wall biosynthesis
MELKILQIGPIPPDAGGKTIGGVQTHVWDLASHLAKRGYEVAILSDNFPVSPETPAIKDGVRIYGVSGAFVLKHIALVLQNLSVIRGLKKHFKRLTGVIQLIVSFCCYDHVIHHFKPDVIHVHTLERRFPFAYFVSRGEIPIVTTVHSFNSIRFYSAAVNAEMRELLRRNLRITKNIVLVSRFVKDQMTELFGNFDGNCWILHNPVDASKYTRLSRRNLREEIGESPMIPIVLFVGSFTRRKGIYALVKAIEILKNRGVTLRAIIIGRGPELPGIINMIRENGTSDIFRFEHYIKDLPLFYNAADLLVLPSTSEGFALVYVEAMSCGLPVVGSKGIADESIPSENYGLLVDSSNPDELATAIERGLRKKWDRAEIAKYGHSFSWEKQILKFEEIYRKILE